MKRLALVAFLVAVLASPAMAGQVQVGYPGSSYGAYQTGLGGEFTLNPLTGWLPVSQYYSGARNVGVNGSFQTFCIEGTETIAGYTATYEATLSGTAMYGGQTGGDPISKGTGWLYTLFATNGWSSEGLSYDYGAGRATSADQLQRALWWLEGEAGITYVPGANAYIDAVVARFGSVAAAQAANAGEFHVYAVNLWAVGSDIQHSRVQDQLYYSVPDGGATLMLLGGALMGLGALRRKFRG